MKERLIIRNFGPIKSINLELGKITILIGEQASGKSTVAKVLAICRYFSFIVDDSSTIVNYKSNFSHTALKAWGLDGFENNKSYISYENTDYSVEIKNVEEQGLEKDENGNSLIEGVYDLLRPHLTAKSGRFKNLLKEYEKLKPARTAGFGIISEWRIPHSFLTTDVKNVMDNPFYFPSERGLQSIFSLGKSSLENMSNSLFNQFARLDQVAKSFKLETLIEPLNITYQNKSGEGYFKHNGNMEYYKLSQGAGGYKSATPIVLGIKHYSLFEKRERTFIIEEPEINLFPSTQRKLMEFFVKNLNDFGHSFIIPTHSPYFLSVINDLLMSFKKGQINELATKTIINKSSWLNPLDLAVYELKEGAANSIINQESGLIDDNIIDEVSDDLNEEFLDLLEIK